MPNISRRRLLQGAGTATAAAFAAEFLPGNVRRALAAGPSRGGSIRDIKHVVILMQENRSFDHYFGTLPNVRGFSDPNAITLSSGQPVWYQPDTANPDGYLLPFHVDTTTTSGQSIPSTSHAWNVQHESWDDGAMDGFVTSHNSAQGTATGQFTMAYLDRGDIPFHYALAENFTICDGYHCSLLGPTWPNRLYLMSAWIDPAGVQGGPIISNQHTTPYGWKSYPEALTEAGVSWKVYQEADNYGCNVLEYFNSFQTAPVDSPLYRNGLRSYQDGQFEWDALHDRLPTVSWLIPTSYQSEHPDYTPAAGADFVASKINAIAANPEVWNKTVFILNYDENDGLFDHVVPPTPPAGTPGEFLTDNPLASGSDGFAGPIGGGFRVPCLIVSPWTMGGWIASETFDHTSTLQFLERLTGVAIPNISAWRRQTFGDLTSAFGAFTPGYGWPRLPDTKAALAKAVYEVNNLPAPEVPAGAQALPTQTAGRYPRPRP